MQRLLVTVLTVAAIALFAPPSAVEVQSNTKPVIAPSRPQSTLQSEVASRFTGDVRIALSRDLQIPFSLESGTTLPSPESPCYYARAPICAMPPLENPKVESHGRLLGLGGASV